MSAEFPALLWPASRLGEEIQRLTNCQSTLVNPPARIQDKPEALAVWL